MSRIDCPMEHAVLEHATELDPALRQHVATCETCGQALETNEWMKRLAATTAPADFPDPARIWLKATLLRARTTADEVARPIDLVQKVSYASVVAAWAATAVWQFPHLLSWIDRVRSQALVVGSTPVIHFSPNLFWIFSGLTLVTIALSVHAVLQED